MKLFPNKSVLFINKDYCNHSFSVATFYTKLILKRYFQTIIEIRASGKNYDFFKIVYEYYKTIRSASVLYIITDGNSNFDKFVIFKLINPSIKIIWEIHGPVEETLFFHNSIIDKLNIFVNSKLRIFWAKYVNSAICLTDELEQYAKNTLNISQTYVVNSFTDSKLFTNSNNHATVNKILNRKLSDSFVIFWGGESQARWQALDIIDDVAQRIWKIDKNIIFVLSGNELWHNFRSQKNIIHISFQSYSRFIALIRFSDVCLSIYHDITSKITGLPFYFSPRKTIEYMTMGKPVIATNLKIHRKIIHNRENGFLVSNKVDKIVNLIMELKHKPNFKKYIGKNAKKSSKQNSFQYALNQYRFLFSDL